MTFRTAVLDLVRRIPRGRVATYGQLALLLERPRSARQVGQALRGADSAVPWHRVVNAQGGISRRSRTASMMTQRIRLEQEGIVFRRGRVVLTRFRWHGSAGTRRDRDVGKVRDDRLAARKRLNLSRHDGTLGGQG